MRPIEGGTPSLRESAGFGRRPTDKGVPPSDGGAKRRWFPRCLSHWDTAGSLHGSDTSETIALFSYS